MKNKRLESLTQLGVDRIIDLQFGSSEAAYHVILELYDRGNIVLTDHQMTILYVLRPHTEGDKIRFAVRETYPQNRAREEDTVSREKICKILEKAKLGDQLKKVLISNLGNILFKQSKHIHLVLIKVLLLFPFIQNNPKDSKIN